MKFLFHEGDSEIYIKREDVTWGKGSKIPFILSDEMEILTIIFILIIIVFLLYDKFLFI